MPRLARLRRGTVAKTPEEAKSTTELQVQRLAQLLDGCSREGILNHRTLLSGANDCQYCPCRELCDKVWDECTEYSNSPDYDVAEARLKEVFAQKHKISGNKHRTKYYKAENIKRVAKLWGENIGHLTYRQIAQRLGISLRTVTRCVAILKQEQVNRDDKAKR